MGFSVQKQLTDHGVDWLTLNAFISNFTRWVDRTFGPPLGGGSTHKVLSK